ncbi:MAG: hypothetical protein ACRCXZ_06460 [Patescibacteria group bacterium]
MTKDKKTAILKKKFVELVTVTMKKLFAICTIFSIFACGLIFNSSTSTTEVSALNAKVLEFSNGSKKVVLAKPKPKLPPKPILPSRGSGRRS